MGVPFSLNKKSHQLAVVFAVLAVLALTFQNCSKYSFGRFNLDSQNGLNSQMMIEDGAPATNKQLLKVSLGPFKENYTQMRISSQEDQSQIPWITYSEVSKFNLNDLWAAEGKKDGVKTLYAELKTIDGQILKLSASIGLDTIAPKIEPVDLLKSGPMGKKYSLGQEVEIKWSAEDAKAVTGYSSGFDPDKGLRISHTLQADCSTQTAEVTGWSSYRTSYPTFKWPYSEPNKTFYICVHVKDRAGNLTTLLSQPMMSLWSVVAGDNNQGTGGTITAPNIRFKKPTLLEVDSTGSVYIYDEHFRNLKYVNSATTKIELIAGNGTPSSFDIKKDLRAQGLMIESMAVDSKDNLYFTRYGVIYRLVRETDKFTAVALTLVDWNCTRTQIDIKKDKTNGDVLFGVGLCTFKKEYETSAQAGIFRIPLAELEQIAETKTYPQLLQSHLFTGNLTIPRNDDDFSQSVDIVGTPLASNPQHAVGSSLDLVVTNDETVFVGSIGSGNVDPWGKHMIRAYKRKDANTVMAYPIDLSAIWTKELHILQTQPDQLILSVGAVASNVQKRIYNLKMIGDKWTEVSRVDNFVPSAGSFLSSVVPVLFGGAVNYLVLSVDKGKVFRLDDKYQIKESWGRNVYNESELVATSSALNFPSGLAITNKNEILFFERYTSIVRKVTPSGQIQYVSGNPFENKLANFVNSPLPKATYLGAGLEFVKYNMTTMNRYSDNAEVITLSSPHSSGQKLDELNLNSNLVNTISQTVESNFDNPLQWRIYHTSTGSPSSLLISRNFVYTSPYLSAVLTEYKNGVEKIIVGSKSSSYAAVPLTPALNASFVRIVSQVQKDNFLFFTAQAEGTTYLYWIDRNESNPVLHRSAGGVPYYVDLGVLKNAGGYSVCGLANGLLDCSRFMTVADLQKPTFEIQQRKLCLPGAYLTAPEDIEVDADQNLVISDSGNARLLRYYSSIAKVPQLVFEGDSNCPK